jgi:hypothetical protein
MGYNRISCGVAYKAGTEDALLLQGWLVEGQLDSKRMQEAWWALVKDWPLLAARLRVNPARKDKPGREKWDFEIPDGDQVKLLEKRDNGQMEHDKTRVFAIIDRRSEPVCNAYSFKTAADLPTDRVSVLESRNDVQDMEVWACNQPASFARLLKDDRPMVCVSVSCFQDATMICIAQPAVLGIAVEELARIWTTYIKGSGTLPTLEDEIDDPLPRLELEPPAPPGWRIMAKEDPIVERVLWEKVVNLFRRKKSYSNEKRAIFVPQVLRNQIYEQAMQDAGAEKHIGMDDVLAAWMIKVRF